MNNDSLWQQSLRDAPRGFSLPQPSYVDPVIYEAEIDRFLSRHRVIAGHSSPIPESGDYFITELLGAPIIVLRDASGANAVHNVCRHRGGFLSFMAAMCDYGLMVTYLPHTVDTTRVVMQWLVRADANEDRDCGAPEFTWQWDETTKQDKSLIELNAAGVATRGYLPRPDSRLEAVTRDFVERYSRLMAADR